MKRNILLLALLLCTAFLHAQRNKEHLRKLQLAEFAIANLYVDSISEEKLVEEAIIGMLKQLDPHSTYNNAEEVKKMNEPLQGNFEGIGVQFQMIEDTLLVVQPVSNGPSEKVGILAGDRITAVNDTAIAGVKMPQEEIMGRLRGPKGSVVRLTVVRRGVNEPLSFTVKRDKIPIHSLDAAYMIAPRIGYIRINRFGATTSEEFLTAMKRLKKEGMNDLILDLQENGGGYLNAAIDLANEFLQYNSLIVYTQGRNSRRQEFRAKGNGNLQEGRIAVLVDEYSASASEIVTGALQDWDRGVVVGRRSFGKGLVQRPIDLPDGSMMRLTVARYYTPAGRCIQKPYEGNSAEQRQEAYSRDLINRFNRGELMHADSIHFPDSLKYQTKRLQRTVYGGGGIMPDIFVPMDTARYTDYHRNLVAKGVVIKTTMKYIEQHRKELLATYKKFQNFNEKFQVDDALLADLLATAEKENVAFRQEQYEHSLPLIKTQLKALLARDLWDMNEYFQVMNATDDVVQEALRVLTDGSYEKLMGSPSIK
ncbi:MAG: S41 family peptidase [Bacteroides sp.]|nr:S41 family peptidase [Bacteroides sp.]